MNSSYSRGMSEAAKDTGAVLIAAFEGWNDACQAATNAVRHLVKRYESREIRHIRCDDFYDYQVARPMLCHVSGRTNLIWPQTTFYDITLDAGKHIYAQIAPEPNYRWKEYCSQSLAIADELDVNRIITLGSMFSDCPHTRPLPIAVSDGDCQCEGDRSYNGPVLLIPRCGCPSPNIWAATNVLPALCDCWMRWASISASPSIRQI